MFLASAPLDPLLPPILNTDLLALFQEKEGNIVKVVYVTSALPNTTPVDLSNRPMVASASEARKCVTVRFSAP